MKKTSNQEPISYNDLQSEARQDRRQLPPLLNTVLNATKHSRQAKTLIGKEETILQFGQAVIVNLENSRHYPPQK